ncbi:MAG: carbohydrate kinase family protein [bacterium]|nr:carbohydrate kinase family protein [bacterium]
MSIFSELFGGRRGGRPRPPEGAQGRAPLHTDDIVLQKRADVYDIIAIGDSTTDVFLELADADVVCNEKEKDCLLCFDYAGKVPVSKATEIDAVGNAANNAIGSARLGLKAGIWTMLGKDTNGRQALDVFRAEKVETELIEEDQNKGTNYSVVLNFQAERSILVYHNDRDYNFPELPKADWVYLTSMGHGWEKITADLLDYVEKSGAKLAFNPGTHQLNSGLETMKPLLAKSEFFILNVEEAQKILNSKDDVKTLLQKLAALGPKNVVVTDGQNGAYAWQSGQMWQVSIFPDLGPVVERTGCGDSYATATVAALHYGEPLQEALRWGAANARMVVQYIGAREGLQTKAQIQKTIQEFSDIQPKLI